MSIIKKLYDKKFGSLQIKNYSAIALMYLYQDMSFITRIKNGKILFATYAKLFRYFDLAQKAYIRDTLKKVFNNLERMV